MNIIITGTRKGIGRTLAERYLKDGYNVIGCSRNKTDLVHENYKHYIVDISSDNDIKQMMVDLKKHFSKIDVLINNAGIASMNHCLLTPTTTVKSIFDTNFLGTFLMCREISRLMMNGGRIINFSTVARPLNLEGEAIYASSKSAVETLTKILAKELSVYKITVNALAPTPIATDLIAKVSEKKINKIIEQQSIKRMGTFDDVKNIIDFYINPASDFITGQILYMGGITQ